MAADGLLVSVEGGVAELTLSRPTRLNALTPDLVARAIEALDGLERDAGLRAVVLSGAGEAFCAGWDLDLMTSPGGPQAGLERDEVERLCARVVACRVPVVAKLRGVASGGGCELAVACDLRVAAETARLGLPPARLGILTSTEGLGRLCALVGPAAAKELLFTGALVDAGRALALRLVDRVVAEPELDAEVARLAGEIAANAPLAVTAAKRILDGAPPGEAARLQALVWESADAAEGPRAFREKRPPRFEGR